MIESPHFKHVELRCRCCGENRIDEGFLAFLEAVRVECGFPFVLSSAYRCPTHNARVSSTGVDGPHTVGAADVKVFGHQAHRVIEVGAKLGARGIGVSQKGPQERRFLHLDILDRGGPRPWVWSY